ncbi:kinesin-like protein KIN-14J [Ricinus communis]|uniref:kinesin-like protein KIN-14J n=1 Tax=Ricinus communis TaxID=3988 RepID=UPI00077284FD|nr:kinesin-like protein KIN-14J [Ricinus communis]|eukprot:XP_015571512.1 kinesin-like protein KIN-14J [Ricinus communis]
MNIQQEIKFGRKGVYDTLNGSNGLEVHGKEMPEGILDGNLQSLVEWLNHMIPHLNLPLEASEEELRACLIDGTVLCSILNKLSPGLIEMRGNIEPGPEKIKMFLAAMDEMGLPRFVIADIQQGYMLPVLQCLGTLKAHFDHNGGKESTRSHSRRLWNLLLANTKGVHQHANALTHGEEKHQWEVESSEGIDRSQGQASTRGENSAIYREGRQRNSVDDKYQRGVHRPVISEPSALLHDSGHKFSDELPLKQGLYGDLSDSNILELMKSNGLDSASTRTLFSLANRILDDSTERKNGQLQHMTRILKKIVQVIEQRFSTQANNLKDQNNLYNVRTEKYQSRIRVLETLASGTTDEIEVLLSHLQQIKIEKIKIEQKEKLEEQDLRRLKEEKNHSDIEKLTLKQELELAKKTHEEHYLLLEDHAKETKVELEKKLKELESLLAESRNKVEELESFSESKSKRWRKKEGKYRSFMDHQFKALEELRASSESIKHEVLKTKRSYFEEFQCLGYKLKGLAEAAENYHSVLAENRRLYNEVQDLKGNIRVYCRVRPFLPGQCKKQTTIEYIGENGELVVSNPCKQGKDSHRLFKFNKVFGPATSQEEVFLDTRPLIRSVLDGYNVCIFAYGQTGSGKTYTMSGPNLLSEEDWGVNYRALHDLFQISQTRRSSMRYEVGVQMVEIYNEQVRDLLSSDGPHRRLGIWSTTQPNGLAVPDASMRSVKSTSDVLELMNIGLMNRAIGSTALNERSSRSHSVLTVHVRGMDLKTSTVLRGNLHLIDLAGSERVERSEATGDRLKEAQHINKSLSALGDVIFALAQKSAHVPYRNSKLTQVLQSSLGGQAKTLMFVQLNPDVDSYSETISTLKFAERVSGVELGAARSNKEGRDIRELMQQVTSLKDTITKKDEEIERLQLLKPNIDGMKHGMNLHRSASSSPRRHSTESPSHSPKATGGKGSGIEKGASDADNSSEYSEKRSETGSLQSVDDCRRQKGFLQQSKSMDDLRLQKDLLPQSKPRKDAGQNSKEDIDLLGFGDGDSDERLSDISDGGLSMGTETDSVEFTLFPEPAKSFDSARPFEAPEPAKSPEIARPVQVAKPTERAENTEKQQFTSKLPRPPQKLAQTRLSRMSLTKSATPKASSAPRKIALGSSSATRPPKRWQ